MADSSDIGLNAATADDAVLLSNLLELYIHDLSAAFPSVELGRDGRFGYSELALYWSEPDRRFPFLITSDSRPVGFALAARGSPASEDPNVFDVREFFVIRRHRRSGVGRRVVAEFTGGAAEEFKRPGRPHGWHVCSFGSGSAGPSQ